MDYSNGNGRSSNREIYERIAYGLGWFSIGLGLAELLAPGKLSELIGVADDEANRKLLRGYGLREIAAGAGILAQPGAAGWLWARVAGDALDLGSLGKAMASNESGRGKLAVATGAVLGVAALDILCGQKLSSTDGGAASKQTTGNVHVTQSVIVDRPQEYVYRYWRNFENLPNFMRHVESVLTTGLKRSHWKVKAPAGRTVEWDAEMTEDVPNSRISWRSLPGADIDNYGTVMFQRATGNRGTVVKVDLHYDAPGGKAGALIAKLFGEEPEQQVYDDLHAFKQIMEVGEIATSDASIHQRMHAAQPPKETPSPVGVR